MQRDFLLLGSEFREVHAGKLRGAVGVFQKNFAGVLERFHSRRDGETEQSANLRFIKRGIHESGVLLNDAPFRVQNERRRQGGYTAISRADVIGSHGDGIIDAGFLDVFLDVGGVVVVDIKADDLQAALKLLLKINEVGHFGATRPAPGGPKIEKNNFAVKGIERDGLAVERLELEIGRRIGIADETDDGLVVLVCESQGGQSEKR